MFTKSHQIAIEPLSTVKSESGSGTVWAAGSDTHSITRAKLEPWNHFRLLYRVALPAKVTVDYWDDSLVQRLD